MKSCHLPRVLSSGSWPYRHCQGIAVDAEKRFIYYSFTTALVKMSFDGRVIGAATGLLGHLGCIDFCKTDGRVYGSLEYKNDVIGRGILERVGHTAQVENAFYIAAFDVDRIDRMEMDACTDGVMTAVYLKEVYDDYMATVVADGRETPHRHGCSGIDGTTFGKMPGTADDTEYLFVAYGVYGDETRTDNDDQVILCYDAADLQRYAQPLSQRHMHRSGPEHPLRKLFVRTGNTTYGVQNLKYDPATGNYYMAVYRGRKAQYPNYDLYVIDGSKPPVENRLTLLGNGRDELTPGWRYSYGATGLCPLENGLCYVSQEGRDGELYNTKAVLCRWDGCTPFVPVE